MTLVIMMWVLSSFWKYKKIKLWSKRRWEVAARLETVSRNRHSTHVPSVLFTLVCSVLRYDSPPPDLQPDQIGPSPDSEIIKDCYLGRPLALVLVFCEVLFCE